MNNARERQRKNVRQPKRVVFEEAGVRGIGKNITAAKADWHQKVQTMLEGTYAPVMIRCHDRMVFIWRDPPGWQYKIIRLNEEKQDRKVLLGTVSGPFSVSRDATERAARVHLAQDVFTFGGFSGLSAIVNSDDRKDHVKWVAFQYSVKTWMATGLTENQAFAVAGYNSWPDGVTPVDVWKLPG